VIVRALLFALALSFSLAPGLVLAQKARVTMVASAPQVEVGDPFIVEIAAAVSGAKIDDLSVPDFGKLQVLGRSVSRPTSFSFSFGSGGQQAQVQSQVVYDFTLRATEPGNYVIQPAIATVEGRRVASQKLTILVTGSALPQPPGMDPNARQPSTQGQAPDEPADQAAAAPPTGALSGARYDNDLFLRTVVDKPEAQLGEQVTVTVYLYVRGGLSQNPSITREPTAEGFWVQDLLPVQRSLAPMRQDVNGRAFNVFVLRRFAAFALRPGKLEIGAPAIEISAGDSLFDLLTGPRETVRRNGVSVGIQVNPLPATPGQVPVHVGTLSLEASLDPVSAKVGDAVTLRVSAKGQGNLKALKLPNPVLDGVEVLAPEIDDKVSVDLDQVGGERTFRWLLLPKQPGKLTLPPFSVKLFDVQSKSLRDINTAALELQVSGSPQASAAPAKAEADPAVADAVARAASFGPARTRSSLARGAWRLDDQPWFLWAVLAAPGLALASVLGSSLRRRLRERRKLDPHDQALRNADAKLQEAELAAKARDAAKASAALISALRAALQAQLGEPVGGLTLSALETLCLARGMVPALAERVVASLSEAEQVRFDPSRQEGAALERQVTEVRSLVREVGRFKVKEAA
jgi:hypothetical protein